MRGLSLLEADALRRADSHCTDGAREVLTDGERAMYRILIDQGRAQTGLCSCHGIPVITITAAGLEALALWRKLQEGEGKPKK